MLGKRSGAFAPRLVLVCAMLGLLGACSTTMSTKSAPSALSLQEIGIDADRKALAFVEVKEKKAKGQRVWCVPYARTLSGVQLRGNAGTWWNAAKGVYERGHEPELGAVMVFSSTKKLPMGHVAVVSDVVNDRELLINHANWKRNQVSTAMKVVDVSKAGDWSSVKVESQPGSYGRVYPISGFVYPTPAG